MKFSVTILFFSLYRVLYAQDGLKQFNGLDLLGTQLTCNNRNPPSITCNENPVDNVCSCSCTNGVVYKQLHPSLWANSSAGSLCPQCPPTNFLPRHPTKLTTKPCLDVELQGWTRMDLPHEAHSLNPSELVTKRTDISEDSVMVVADSARRCQHYEVYIDGELLGETSGDGPLDDFDCGTPENCIENHGGSHGYFVLPKGQHTVGIRWVKVTEACQQYPAGVGSFKIFRRCQKDQQDSADQQESNAQLRACEVRNLEEQRQSSAQLLECQEQANIQLGECKQQDLKNQQDHLAELSSCKAESLKAQQDAALQLGQYKEQALQEKQHLADELALCKQESEEKSKQGPFPTCPGDDGKEVKVEGKTYKLFCGKLISDATGLPWTTVGSMEACIKQCALDPKGQCNYVAYANNYCAPHQKAPGGWDPAKPPSYNAGWDVAMLQP